MSESNFTFSQTAVAVIIKRTPEEAAKAQEEVKKNEDL